MSHRIEVPVLIAVFAFAASLVATPAAAGLFEPQFQCGEVSGPGMITASDALGVLRAAVGLETHSPCAADADGNRTITASDAQRVLRAAVGQEVDLNCPFCCSHCGCTPQQIAVTLSDVDVCEDCIPRVPVSNTGVDSVRLVFAGDVNDTYELEAVSECVWRATVPGGIAEKDLYSSGVSDCSGSSQTFGGADVQLVVTRDSQGWQVRVGQYAVSLDWGDVAHSFLKAANCATTVTDPNENETCHLAGSDDPFDRDTHAVDGEVSVAISDPDPVCP